MEDDFLNPRAEIARHGGKLPHWQQGVVWEFVTFRLKDSVPASVARDYRLSRAAWLRRHPQPWSESVAADYHAEFTAPWENWLDRGLGSCVLKNPSARAAVSATLQRDQGSRAQFAAWVVMPNHVHVLCRPLIALPRLVAAWKSVSAREIGLGPIWQSNYRDTLLRNSGHFAAVVRYIRRNPASLKPGEFTLWESDDVRELY